MRARSYIWRNSILVPSCGALCIQVQSPSSNGSLSMLSAFINGKDIKTGTVISVVAKSVAPGETLALEYPNKSRVSGKVISASHSELELEINSEAWRLRPHAPSDSTIHNDLSDKDASFWTVQAKL
jgi:hypothetical protein